MTKRLCVGGRLDGQWTEVLDGQAFFEGAAQRTLLYTRRRFMPVGGRGHVEVFRGRRIEADAPKQVFARGLGN